jgi:hypothetical protein
MGSPRAAVALLIRRRNAAILRCTNSARHTTMNLEQFQATKKAVPDIGVAIDDESLKGRPGLVYGDTSLFIETRCAEWDGSRAAAYEFYLCIGNQEWLSNDLSELEERLHDFGVAEGHFEPPVRVAQSPG